MWQTLLKLLDRADALLRNDATRRPTIRTGLLLMCLAGGAYGAVMGSFGVFAGARVGQLAISATKVPLLLMATFAFALPSFYVVNLLLGLGADFRRALSALLLTQAALTLVLLALAPLVLVWYASVERYEAAILFNAAMFGIASISAQVVLRRLYRPLVAIHPRHRLMRRAWLVMYAFVGVQCGWVLRPFVGQPGSPVRLFREGAWGNAYEEVIRLVASMLR
ncbi:MAG: hypothetical protein QM770_16225 [Tepidisphaeraceae bacterium]